LNVIDYILYKDYKIVKSTSFENLDVELSSFDLLIIDLPYWQSNTNIYNGLKGYSNIPLILLTEDKNSPLISILKEDFYVKAVLKEPLSKKELKENVKELTKKKKNKKEKDKGEDKADLFFTSPIQDLVSNNDIVFFKINDLQDKRIEYISDNYKSILGTTSQLSNLKELSGDIETPFISFNTPQYAISYKLNSTTEFKVIKETGKGIFDATKYLTHIEGYISDYTEEYVESVLLQCAEKVITSENFELISEEFIRNIIHVFSSSIPKDLFQLSIAFSGKDYFTSDFIPTEFLVSSDIHTSEKRLGEVLIFSLNNNFEEKLKSFSKLIAEIVLFHFQKENQNSAFKNEINKQSQELALTKTSLAQAEAAFKDKAGSYDNLNELFSSAMKDYKTVSAKLNRNAIIFETNSEGKIIAANENYYRATGTDKANIVGRYFDDLFENLNWQNFQFEFFNNSNQEILLKQRNKDGKSFYFSFYVSREENNNEYKFVFYGKDKSDSKKYEIELGKQVSEYNTKVNELIESKKTNEFLWGEINSLKEELKNKEEQIKKLEKKVSKYQEREDKLILTTPKTDTKEYNLENQSAGIKFEEDVKEKIEEAKEELDEQENEEESVFKNLRGIDFKKGLFNAHDNVDTYNEILVNFENDYLEFVKAVKAFYLVNDNESIKSKLSSLSEEAKYIGAEDLEKSAQLFYDKLNENKINNFDFELSVLGVHLSFTLDSIRKYKEDYALYEQNKPEESKDSNAENSIGQETNVEPKEEVKEEVFDSVNLAEESLESKEINEDMHEEIFDTFKLDEDNLEPEETEELKPIQQENKIEENHVEQIFVVIEDQHEATNELTSATNIFEEKKEEQLNEFAEEKPLDSFSITVNELKNLIQNSAEASIIKEKLFSLKFQNSDFSKIEKIETLESNIENGDYVNAQIILDQLKS